MVKSVLALPGDFKIKNAEKFVKKNQVKFCFVLISDGKRLYNIFIESVFTDISFYNGM